MPNGGTDDVQLRAAEQKLDEDRPGEALPIAEAALALGGAYEAEALYLSVVARGRIAARQREAPKEAEAVAEDWLSRAKAAGNRVTEAAALVACSELAFSREGGAAHMAGAGRKGRAERKARQALALLQPAAILAAPEASQASARRLRAAALRQTAALCAEDWDADGALKAAEEARDLAKDDSDGRGEAFALHAMALARGAQDPPDLEEALRQEAAAVALASSLGLRRLQAQWLCQMVYWSIECGKSKDALKYAQEAHSIRTGTDEVLAYITALGENAQSLKALHVAKEAVMRARKSDIKSELADSLEIVAREFQKQGNMEQALASFKEAIGHIRQTTDRNREFSILHEMAVLQIQMHQLTKAASTLRDAVAISQSTTEKANSLCALGEVQVDLAEYTDALESATAAQEKFEEASDARGRARAVLVACAVHGKSQAPQKAMAAAQLAHEVAFVGGQLDIAAKAQKTMAEMYLVQQKPEQAMAAVTESIKLWQEWGDAAGLGEAMRMAATLSLRQGNLQEATEVTQQALELSTSAGDWTGEAHARVLLARIYAKQYEGGDKGEAGATLNSMLESAAAAQALATQVRDRPLQAVASQWYATALLMSRTPPPEDALRFARKAQSLFREAKDASGEAQSLALTAQLLVYRKEFEQASQNVTRSLDLATASGDAEAERVAREASAAVERARAAKSGGRVARGRPGRPGAAGAESPVAAAAPPGAGGPSQVVATAPKLDLSIDEVKAKVLDMVRESVGDDIDIHAESALMDSGMDSLSSIDFTNQVTKDFNLTGSQSLVFDYPTVTQIVDFIMQEAGQ